MKKLCFIIGFLILNVIITLGLIDYFVWSHQLHVESGQTVQEDLVLNDGTIVLDFGSTVKGKIQLTDGSITVSENVTVIGDIELGSGRVIIGKNVVVKGNIMIENGNIELGENAQIEGNVVLKKGTMRKHSTGTISGLKPVLYVTTNWPAALAFFDALPQKHKEAVGYIFLTKENNTIIRDENITTGIQYFDGIYTYNNGKLIPVDLTNPTKVKPFFDKAKKFFGDLPERRLGPFSVGATTKTYAQNPKKADIYVPSIGSEYTFIHEMGHVLDFQNDFIDLHQPKYPFISKEVALNEYGATHPGEDFAEAYKYYVMNPEYFGELIDQAPERQQKYDFLEKHVFDGFEYKNFMS